MLALVVDGELAAAGPAGGQALQQGAALADRAGAGLMRHRAGVLPDLGLVGLVGVPVDEPLVVVFDQHLPLVLRQHAAPDPDRPVVADQPLLPAAAEGIRAGVGGVGQHVVHRVVGRLGPDDLGSADVGAGLQRELQALLAQPQPDPAHRPARREPLEDRGDDAGDGLVGMHQDLPVGLAPDQPDRQAAAQLAAGGLVPDPAVQAGPQDMQLSFGHGALHPQHQPVIEQRRMIEAVGVGDQGVGHPGQVQQPIPVGVVAGQPRDLQRQHDPDLPHADLGGQLARTRDRPAAEAPETPQVLVDDRDRGAGPAQLAGPGDQVVLAGGGLAVAFHLRQGRLADIDYGRSGAVRGGDLPLTHRRLTPAPGPPWRSAGPAARAPPRRPSPGSWAIRSQVAPEPGPAAD